ncbi:MAG: BRCT domain-containing protein [Snowella sp.]|nr:BRCT domain-containing protein [Snowella sp.]
MDNEIVYQIGGLVIILGGFILGLKFISGQGNQTSQETELASISGNENYPNTSHEIAEKPSSSTAMQFFLDNENISLKGRIFHLEKQLTSSQNWLKTLENEKIELENQLAQEQIKTQTQQQQLQQLTAAQVARESDYQKQRQELLLENQYLSQNLRQEVANRTELQRQFYASAQREKQFEQREQHQQQMIQELERKNRELSDSRIGDTVCLQQQLDRLRDEKRQIDAVVQEQVANAKKLQSEIAQLIEENRDRKVSHQSAIAEIETLKQQIQTLETEKARLTHDVRIQTEELIQEKIQQEQAIAELQKHIRQLEKDHSPKPSKHQAKRSTQAPAVAEPTVTQSEILESAPVMTEPQAVAPVTHAEIQVEKAEIKSVDSVQPQKDKQPEPVPANQAVVVEPESLAIAPEINPVVEKVTESVTTEAVEPEAETSSPSQNIFDGKKFIIVGTLTQINREQAKNLIQEAGGSVTSSPSSKTNYVLVGKSPGDKLKKAQKLGISQLSEAQFLHLLAGH